MGEFSNQLKNYFETTSKEQQTGISKSNIRRVLKNERNSAGGFV